MKKLILTLSLILTPALFAGELENQVLEALIKDAAQIQLIDASGALLQPDFQLVPMIARHLRQGYSNLEVKGGILASVGIQCAENATGLQQYTCKVQFMNGDFEITRSGDIRGPNLDSAILFDLQISIPANGGKAIIQTRRARAELAG